MTMPFTRRSFAILLAGVLAVGPIAPVFAQNAPQGPPPAPTPQTTTNVVPFSLGTAKYNYTHAPRPFPNLFAPYRPISIPEPVLTNGPKIDQMIKDGKLELTLEQAIELALVNNVDIAVARYYPWLADTGILKAESGGFGFGTPGAAISGSSANLPTFNFDPTLSSTLSFTDNLSPVNNPLIAGTGAAPISSVQSHTSIFNLQYNQGFATGTNVFVSWDNTRGSSNAAFNTFNPFVQSAVTIGIQQQLLNGFGLSVNRRNIIISKTNRKIADYSFTQTAITTITNVINAYWELVYARENVKVNEQAVEVSQKLYNDNKKQLEIGTMAPLDVTRAESELATDQQDLIFARTLQLQQQQVLINAIVKDPLAPTLVNVEIVPTDEPTPPATIEAPSFEDSVKEALDRRPDLAAELLNLKNADIDVNATRRALLPSATLGLQYSSVGLAGNSPILSAPVPAAGAPVVDTTGTAVTVLDANGNPIPIFIPTTTQTQVGLSNAGFGDAQSQIFHNNFPTYVASLNLQLPLRNRSAQADNQRSILAQRQMQTALQQLKNSIVLDVRQTYVALVQDRAQVDAAVKASELQKQTFEAEQKKYQLGASTVYNVILTQRDYVAAQGTELRALANLVEAKANYERALGRTLDVNHVSIADAKSGVEQKDTLIPGTLMNGQVVGVDELIRNLSSGDRK